MSLGPLFLLLCPQKMALLSFCLPSEWEHAKNGLRAIFTHFVPSRKALRPFYLPCKKNTPRIAIGPFLLIVCLHLCKNTLWVIYALKNGPRAILANSKCSLRLMGFTKNAPRAILFSFVSVLRMALGPLFLPLCMHGYLLGKNMKVHRECL